MLEGEDAPRASNDDHSRVRPAPASPAPGLCACAPGRAGVLLPSGRTVTAETDSRAQVEAPRGSGQAEPRHARLLANYPPSSQLTRPCRTSDAPVEPVAVLGRALPPVSADAGWFLDSEPGEPHEPPGVRFSATLQPRSAELPWRSRLRPGRSGRSPSSPGLSFPQRRAPLPLGAALGQH